MLKLGGKRAGVFAIAGALGLSVSAAQAAWQITTYKLPRSLEPVELTTMAGADAFLASGPKLIDETGTVTQVDLWENSNNGQFTINNPFPGLTSGDTDDFAAVISGTLVVNTAGRYDFFTDTDDGNRFRLDLDQDGIFEDFGDLEGHPEESIVPDGGLQGAGTPERSLVFNLATGNYKFEITMFERSGGASVDAGYRQRPLAQPAGPQKVLGDASGGISLLGGSANVRVAVADTSLGTPITTFFEADALRTGTNEAGFPQSGVTEVFNIHDSGGDADFANGVGAPGLGDAGLTDDNDFMVVGTGTLVVPTGGVTDAIFRSNTDDGGRLLIDVNQDGDLLDLEDTIILQDVLQGPTNTDSLPVSLAAGNYTIEYSWFERGGGGEGEVSVSLAGGAAGTFTLLGDDAAVAAGTGLDVIGGTLPGIPGDFDSDGDVDGADFLVGQREGFNTLSLADWKAHFGETDAVASAAGVPEPAALVMALVAAAACRMSGRPRRGR
ncbi:MAG: hypothetical protein DCC67_08025 [Planctomycetota bacterium]|nr:MAG: hypothetical protein DCC67_08025 [Planctomycetota bacterium]